LGGVAGAAYIGSVTRPDLGADLWVAAEQHLGLLARPTPAPDPIVSEAPTPEPVRPPTERAALTSRPEPVEPLVSVSDPVRDEEISSAVADIGEEASQAVASSEQAPEIAVPAQADPTPAADGFEFVEQTMSISESMPAVPVVIRRLGSTLGESTVTWWTLDGTAIADEDYVGFGARIETFRAGEVEHTILLPLIMDSIEEPPERFYVQLDYDSTLGQSAAAQLEITVVDDD
jgi:hypothetical protein